MLQIRNKSEFIAKIKGLYIKVEYLKCLFENLENYSGLIFEKTQPQKFWRYKLYFFDSSIDFL